MTDYLDLEDLLTAAERFLGVPAVVRDYGLLESAAARPQSSAFGRDAYPTLDLKAAALLQGLVANHALVDGNKRLGWVACRLFYALNDEALEGSAADEAVDLVMAIADGTLYDVPTIADRLRAWRG